MLDARDAGPQRILIPPVPSAWARVPLIRQPRFLDDRPDLIDRDLRRVWRVDGRQTPPLAMTLIQSAPARICSRAARRTASTPSAMPEGRSLTAVCDACPRERPAVAVPARLRKRRAAELGPWPRESALRQGSPDPGRRVARIADRRHSRSPGTPGRSEGPCTIRSVADRWTLSATGSRRSVRWTWQSMMPGRTVSPVASNRSADSRTWTDPGRPGGDDLARLAVDHRAVGNRAGARPSSNRAPRRTAERMWGATIRPSRSELVLVEQPA